MMEEKLSVCIRSHIPVDWLSILTL